MAKFAGGKPAYDVDEMVEHHVAHFSAALKNFKLSPSGEYYEVILTVPLDFGSELLDLVAVQQRTLNFLVSRKKRGGSFNGT